MRETFRCYVLGMLYMRETFSRVYSNRYTVRRNGSSKFMLTYELFALLSPEITYYIHLLVYASFGWLT